MAKQIKKVIDERTAKLKALGYELVPESKGAYQTIREVDRLTIERKDIEYLTEQEWSVVMEKVEADHTKHMKAVEGEHIPQPEHTANGASEGIGTTMVVTMDINKDVAALIVDTNKLAIAEMKKAYAGLEFKDLKDEANNNLIKTGHDKARKLRIAVEKRETFLKAPYIAGSKKIGEVAKEYYFLLGEIENPLKEQVNLMKAAEAAEETRKLEELEKEGTRRVEVLKEAGMRFDGQFYCIAERSMDYASIKAMTLEGFEELVEKVKADKKRLDDLAAQELEQLKVNRMHTRSEMLKSIGMEVINGGAAYATPLIEGVTVLVECLTDEPDDKFMTLFSSLSSRIADAKNKAKEEAEKKAKERTLNMRSKLLLTIGMERLDWIPGTKDAGFYFKNAFIECQVTTADVEVMPDEAFDKLWNNFEEGIKVAKQFAIAEEEKEKKSQQLIKDRGQQLVALGMYRGATTFEFGMPNAVTKCSVAYSELTGQSNEDWETTIAYVTGSIAKIKEQQQAFETNAEKEKKDGEDKAAKEAMTFQERTFNLVNIGMAIVGASFIVKNEFGDIASISIDEVKAIDEDVWPRRLIEVTTSVEDVKKQTDKKRQEAIDKANALKPQITKAREYLAAILDIEFPEVTEDKLDGIMSTFKEDLFNAMNKANKALEQVK